MEIMNVTSENFEKEVLNSDKTVLIDFYADWCGPCKMLAPILEKIDFVEVIKINVDEFHELAQEYGVMSIPTLIAFRNGEIINKVIGLQDLEEIKNMFEN